MKNRAIKWGIGAVVVVGIAVGAVIFVNQRQTGAPAAPQTQHNTPAGSNEAGQTTTITYTDAGFSSASYIIKTGGTVTVTNNSSRELEFSSDNHPTHRAEPELNMDTLRPGASGSFTVTKTGTWGFHNHLHAADTGTLTVN